RLTPEVDEVVEEAGAAALAKIAARPDLESVADRGQRREGRDESQVAACVMRLDGAADAAVSARREQQRAETARAEIACRPCQAARREAADGNRSSRDRSGILETGPADAAFAV